MDRELEREIVGLWDDFADAGYEYTNRDGDQRSCQSPKEQREEWIPYIRERIRAFQDGELDLLSFRKEMDTESKPHNYWGFRGMSQMVFLYAL